MNQSFQLLVYRKLYACMISLMLLFSFVPVNSLASGNFQLTAIPGCKENILSWKALNNASTYQVYLYLSDGTTYPLFDFPRPDLFHSHKDLTEGKEYCYVVVAYDKDAKEIGKSNRACAIPKNCDEPNEDECEIELKYTVGKKPYFVNNKPFEMDTEPEIKHNRVHLVISFVTKHIPGTNINWDNADRRVTIVTAKGKTIKLWIDKTKAEIDGKMVEIDPANPGQVAPYIKNSRTYVPMRFAVEQLDATVQWFGETQTVVLKVKDIVNCGCKWICGCIKKGKWVRKDNGNAMQFYFDENCDNVGNEQHFQVDNTLRDLNLNLEFEQYFNSYAHDYWCLELCVDNSTPPKIIKWKATPERYPDCCRPVQPPIKICGCIVRMASTPDQNGYFNASVAIDCNADQQGILLSFPSTLLDENYDKSVFDHYWTDLGGNAVKLCFEAEYDPVTKIVTKWWAYPEKTPPNCCKQECKWICGCFTKYEIGRGGTTIVFNPNCNSPDNLWAEYFIPWNIADQNLGLYIADYIKKYPEMRYWCLDICIDDQGQVVSWKANPEKYPDCCRTTDKFGRIYGTVSGRCNPVKIKIEGIGNTSYSGLFTTNANGQYETSPFSDPLIRCVLPCPGTYRVTPEPIAGYTFSPPYVDIKMEKCCSPDNFSYRADFKCEPSGQKSGRIKVKLPSSCFRGTSFNITDVAIGSVNNYGINDDGIKSGVFDTECTLICGKTYQVEPVNPNFVFSPTYHTVTINNCCPDGFEMVEFDCKPTQKTARIEGIVSGNCNPDAKVLIYDSTGNVVWSGNTNANGNFETSAPGKPCILKCPGTYKVVVTKEGCTFSPANQTVTFSERECCEDGQFKRVEFKCECASNGRIRINFRGNCSTQNVTLVRIYTYPEGEIVLVGNSPIDNQSTYDTFCSPHIKCGKTYKVVPSNPNLTFTPTDRIVTITKCCSPGYPVPPNQLMEVIEFDCKENTESSCCSYTLTPSSKPPGQLKPGEAFTMEYELSNTCPTGSKDITFAFQGSSNLTSITPSKLTLSPGKRATIKVVGTMPKDCKGGTAVTFTFVLSPDCGKEEKFTFTIQCTAPPPSCCDWLFRTRPELRLSKLELCPGETISIEHYEVFNNCPKGSNALTFNITFPNDGKIVSVSPSSFTLQPQERKTLQITIKMPNCKANEAVSFPMKISTRECREKEVEFKAYCKDCWCKHLSKIIKVTKLDLRGGWLEGTPADSKTPIRFYFDATQKQWSNIKLDQCIEICYEERKDRAGNTINWALDYRVVECPKGIPVEQYQVQYSLINDRILFEKEEIQRTKKA